MKYLLIMNMDPAVVDGLSDEEREELMSGHGEFIETIRETGEMISTHALAEPSQSSVVRVRGGAATATDGPFLDSRTFVGGCYLVDCETRKRAQEPAALIPDARIDGLGIEVRPVMFSAGTDM